MARHFTRASTEGVNVSVGNLSFAFGPGTVAAICQKASNPVAYAAIVSCGKSSADDTAGFILWTSSSTDLNVWNGVNDYPAPFGFAAVDGWCLIAATKPSGTGVYRFHKYVYSTNTWTHGDGGGSPAVGGTPIGVSSIGRNGADGGGSGSGCFDGDIAVTGIWDVVLTDAQVESLPFTLAGWFQVQPRALHVLDQSAVTQKVLDLSGGGANEASLTGSTTIAASSVPVFNYGLGAQLQPIQVVAAPTNNTPAAVTGAVRVGSTLTAAAGSWTGADTVAGKWQNSATSGGVYADIAAATASTYVVAAGDLTKYIRYLETATSAGGSTSQESNVVGPVTAALRGSGGTAPTFMVILADA